MHALVMRSSPALLALATSCSSPYDVAFSVRLADDVAVPTGSFIAFAIADSATEPATSRTHIPAGQGVRTYQGKASVCCAPEPKVHLQAFVDIDGDRVLDPDEPRGADPRNPITLTDTATATLSTIVIMRPPTAP